MESLKIAVLGAGNGGQTFAAHLKEKGHEVHLWNRSNEKLKKIRDRKSIDITGALEISQFPDLLSTDIVEVIKDSEVILVVLPAHVLKEIASLISSHINQGQLIVLNPGRTAGSLEFCNLLSDKGVKSLPTIAETQSLYYTCRMLKPGLIDLLAIKNNLELSILPSWNDKSIKKDLKSIYNDPKIVDSTLKTGLDNIGAILHPAPVLLNTGWIESRKDFIPHYYHAISKTIADLLEKMDLERINIANEYGYNIRSVKEWHGDVYGIIKDNLYETLQANSVYASIDAPYNLGHRYIFEDIPTGLVPIRELGKCVNVATPIMDHILSLANLLLGRDFIKTGRNSKYIGIENLKKEEIKRFFQGYYHYK